MSNNQKRTFKPDDRFIMERFERIRRGRSGLKPRGALQAHVPHGALQTGAQAAPPARSRVSQDGVQLRASIATANSAQPWGLMGDSRPPTPSEGRAQYYHRPGPSDQQQTRAYDNGTALTFGPNDLIPEAVPGAAFDAQFNEVNRAVRDLQLSNGQGGQSSTNTANYEYRQFRTEYRDPSTLPTARYPDGNTYRMIPSQFASVEVIPHVRSLVRHSSERPGDAHPDDSADTRFGDNRGQQSSEDVRGHRDQRLLELLESQRSSPEGSIQTQVRVTNDAGDIDEEDGPIYRSRGTFYPGPTMPGYPPPPPRTVFNVPNRARDFGPSPDYQAMGHTSMLDYTRDPRTANVARHSYDMASYHGYQTGYGQPSTSNVSNRSRGFGNPQQGCGSSQGAFNVTSQLEVVPRGRHIQRDYKYGKSHRKTKEKANQEWARELDDRNQADRARGEAYLGGDIDSGEVHQFIRWGVPVEQYERLSRPSGPGLATPRAFGPLQPPPNFLYTEATPLPSRQPPPPSFAAPEYSPPYPPYTGYLTNVRCSSAPSTLPNSDRFADSSFSRILNIHDQRRQSSQSPTVTAGRSSSTESGVRVFGEELAPFGL